jgi:hypothetical protein
MFDEELHGCEIIYVDIASNPSPKLPDFTRRIQADCQELAANAIAKLTDRMLDEKNDLPANRKDFRPFWDWN